MTLNLGIDHVVPWIRERRLHFLHWRKSQLHRVQPIDAMQLRLAQMKKMKPPFTDPRYDMIDPKVQRLGDVALLTFNLVNYGKLPDAPERVLAGIPPRSIVGLAGRGRSSIAIGRTYSRN